MGCEIRRRYFERESSECACRGISYFYKGRFIGESSRDQPVPSRDPLWGKFQEKRADFGERPFTMTTSLDTAVVAESSMHSFYFDFCPFGAFRPLLLQ